MKKIKFLAYIVVLGVLLSACSKTIEQQITEQLELGQKYLLEENYEQAIVAFSKVIELDSKEIQAYTRLLQVYQIMKDTEHADEIIQAGMFALTDLDESSYKAKNDFLQMAKDFFAESQNTKKMVEMQELLIESEPESTEYQDTLAVLQYPDGYYGALHQEGVIINKEYIDKLKYLYELYGDSGIESVKSYLKENVGYFYLDGREDVIYGHAFIETEFYYGGKVYYGETDELGHPFGSGIALCDDNGYSGFWIYIGNWINGRREGKGSYFSVNRSGELSSYDGEWKDDKPNGSGTIYEESQYLDTMQLRSYNRHIGTFKEGYYEGDFINEYSGSEDLEETGHIAKRLKSFNMGKGVPIPEGSIGYEPQFDVFIRPLKIYSDDGSYIITRGCEICIENNKYFSGVDSAHIMPSCSSEEFIWTVFGGFED